MRGMDELYVRDVTHPNGECPLHGTKGVCPCTDTGLFTERELREGWAPRGNGEWT